MVVHDVADVHEGFLAGADLVAGVSVGMAGSGDDGDGDVEVVLSVLGVYDMVLEDVLAEVVALQHGGQGLVV
ncbi:MAG: hypothetical protein ACKORB_03940, partial [Opitutia bacterium]